MLVVARAIVMIAIDVCRVTFELVSFIFIFVRFVVVIRSTHKHAIHV